MSHELTRESMNIDSTGESNGNLCGLKENGVHLYPVSVNDSGEGLPYAPENLPNLGDKWVWKVGKRIAVSGFFLDRYMYLPNHLRRAGQGKCFASRLSLEQYVRAQFPDVDIDAFFASFSWKIPSKAIKKDIDNKVLFTYLREPSEYLQPGPQCPAGNRMCGSLDEEAGSLPEVMTCDICCNEPGFCRECCCILCCRNINKVKGGYNCLRCEANIEGCICGHKCHIDCALRAYMAGTVGGSIGLDAEYYCRRCDSRTDLIPHVKKLLQTCESIDSRDDIEKILNVGICVLRGSKKTSAEKLLNILEMAMIKLKKGVNLEEVWKKEDIPTINSGLSSNVNAVMECPMHEDRQDYKAGSPQQELSSMLDPLVESLKLEDEIDCVLKALRDSQEIEYTIAEETLSFQKNYITKLYQQLDKEKLELSQHLPSKERNLMLDAVQSRISQIKHEISTLKDMEEVAKGFGRVSKRILKEQFDIDIDD